MSIQAAKAELNSLTQFQKEIHQVDDVEEPLISNFYRDFYKSTWHSNISMKLKCDEDGDELTYSVNTSFHYLSYTFMRYKLPWVRVKPEYRDSVEVAWCHNVGSNKIEKAVFKEDDDLFHKWDSVWYDIYYQFYQYQGAGKREAHEYSIGNIEVLENFSTCLPEWSINIDQPWFYSMHSQLSFPIFYKNTQTRAHHRYTLRRFIDLLRVRKRDINGNWTDITTGIHNYIEMGNAQKPELWGRYAYISEQEIQHNKDCEESRVFYIRDVESCDATDVKKYGMTAEIKLQCTNPCLAFFWVAENMDATRKHNYSNYTTDTNDIYNGWDPIKTNELIYTASNQTRFTNAESDHFSVAEPRKHFPSAPSITYRGYHALSYAWDSTSFDAEVGIVLSDLGATLKCAIADNDIFKQHTGENQYEQSEESPSFTLRARLLVMKKFTVSKNSDLDGSYNFEII